MKVLILADAASSHTLKWVRSLSDRGLEVELFSLYDQVEPGIQELANAGKIALDLGERGYAGSLADRRFLRRVRQLRRKIKQSKPDILHAHYASSYGLLGALSKFQPFCISVWGSDVFDFPRKAPMYRRILQFNLRRTAAVYSTSEIMKLEILKYARLPVKVIPFGVDTKAFSPPPAPPDGPFVFGTVKRLTPIYGIDILVQAFAEVQGRHPAVPMELHLAGDGPQREFLKDIAIACGVEQQVKFLGNIPHNSVPDILKKFHVFLTLSRQESFGVAIVEAMSSGLPVIVSDAPGPAEIVEDGVQGFIVPRENVTHAAGRMEELLMSDKLWKAMSIAARQEVLRKYDWEKNVDAQLAAYEEVINY